MHPMSPSSGLWAGHDMNRILGPLPMEAALRLSRKIAKLPIRVRAARSRRPTAHPMSPASGLSLAELAWYAKSSR